MKTIIVWYRNDLRIHDHPALAKAIQSADHVVPLFILNSSLLRGAHAGSNRNRFLIESLHDLKQSLKKIGGDLVIRNGDSLKVLQEVVQEVNAEAVYYTADFSPYAIQRDMRIEQQLKTADIEFRSFSGRLIVGAAAKLRTKNDEPYKVFTPFYKRWLQVGRRELAMTPTKTVLPTSIKLGTIPAIKDLTNPHDLSSNVIKGGETEALKRFDAFIRDGVQRYKTSSNTMAEDATSRLSAYLHFGCISPRMIEENIPDSDGAHAWHRQLCWRDFYQYVLLHYPKNAKYEFQERYRSFKWETNKEHFKAWKDGKTGYPVVDAAMRQLREEGWMHNRARLIVGSFLTKDLLLDWRLGEEHFMKFLVDGDEANNNGNWQWIASVGVDPAPVFRRMYNPTSQHQKFDPHSEYVRRYVPELKNVPDDYIQEPWKMPEDVQRGAKCIIGKDYPKPIVDHKAAREMALERYRAV